MKCDICELDTRLFFYKKDKLIYSLCKSCLRIQEQIDEVNRYQKLLKAIDEGFITKEDFK